MNPPERPRRFVFLDPHGRRWPRLRRVLFGWALLTAIGLVWFLQSVLVRPGLALPSTMAALKHQLRAAVKANTLAPESPNASNWQKYDAAAQAGRERLARIRAQQHKGPPKSGEIRLGYYVQWDGESWNSLEEHAASLTHLAPEWFSLVDTEARLLCEPDPKLAAFAAAHGLKVIPLLRNLSGEEWQPEAVETLANGSAGQRAAFMDALVGSLRRTGAGGVMIDWEQVDPAYKAQYTALLGELAGRLHDAGLELWFQFTPGEAFETFDLEALSAVVDRFVALLSDENSDTDKPGPIASLGWFEGWLKVIDESGDPDQWVIALGAYAYDWNETSGRCETIGFKDAMSRASYSGADADGRSVAVAAPAFNGAFSYSEKNGEHTVCFLDAVSFYNQLRALRHGGFAGVGLNRLGTEDPTLWDCMELPENPAPALLQGLGRLRATDTITHVGQGEVVTVDDTKDDGQRRLEIDSRGRLSAAYFDFPTFPLLYHQGAGAPGQVALTFDDGPDPDWTPQILDVLKARGVPAVFFVVGKNAEDHPGLVRRIFEEGHELGNHTYNHANLAVMSAARMRLELNMTQRLVETITGHSTSLFRPPYNADSTPARIEELRPLKLAQNELGYTVALEKIDPQDWACPGADAILERVKELRSQGSLILLHDAGGDRSQTLEALPRIIDYLQMRGDRIVSLSELLQIPREDLFPPASTDRHPLERIVAGTGFRLWHAVVEFFWAFMILATGLVLARTLLVAWLARTHHRCDENSPRPDPAPAPPVSVIIAAYNEGKVIARTLQSVLATDYPGELEVVVTDDGSSDHTAAEVARLATTEPRIRLLRQPNTGKAGALRNAIRHARHGILVFLDADTLFSPQTIGALVAPMAHPLVGAVSGHLRVGNLSRFVARCQSLEYICGFNLDRRAYTLWNCITVVPGAASALRRSALEAAGGFSHDTLAEDTDLTLTLHRLGYRIEYAPDAVAWTEAPETWGNLARQRARWCFGTMQCLWKHRDMVFNPRHGALGWFSLPGVWFFQIILVALTPLVDGVLLLSLLTTAAATLWAYFAIFLGLDLFLALLACHLEEEPLRRAFTILPMRLVYRPLLAVVVWKSIFRALRGVLVGWGKLERTGAVPVQT